MWRMNSAQSQQKLLNQQGQWWQQGEQDVDDIVLALCRHLTDITVLIALIKRCRAF